MRIIKNNNLGRNWTLVSTVATGSAAISDDAHDPIWEPFFRVIMCILELVASNARISATGLRACI